MDDLGKTRWVFVDGYIPAWSNGPGPEMVSHEAICVLNAGGQVAKVELTVFFADRDPVGPYRLDVPARRTLHQRLNELTDPAPIPPNLSYACVLTSDRPVVVQHTRLDSRQAENAIFSTIAYSG
ncbi:sensory rhodopsin transducer [Brevirhabdus sp.]|uniref:sensory rhodopsin transducer n=1 Tax=Brevirhabdus sp. TaxID=2004514 RepID=UPI004059C5B0